MPALTAVVISQKGDMVDQICWQHYGHTDAVDLVLEHNGGLAAAGPLLPDGVRIELPPAPAHNIEVVQLWDRGNR